MNRQRSGASPPEWTRFSVSRTKPTARWTEPDCQKLESIDHITHMESAARALLDGTIKAALVFDESRLNRDRIRIVWLSPNDWSGAGGSRYGNVKFAFDWKALIQGKNYYWVESMAYRVAAARILVTDSNYDSKLLRYDPSSGDGPWWFDESDDAHYWNGNHCLEIMLEEDLSLEKAKGVDFVDHHSKFCNVAGAKCPCCGLRRDKAGGIFLARIIGQRLDPSKLKWVDNGIPQPVLERAFYQIRRDFEHLSKGLAFRGRIRQADSATLPISRAILGAYAGGNAEELATLMGLMLSTEHVTKSCAKAISGAFGLSSWEDLYDPW